MRSKSFFRSLIVASLVSFLVPLLLIGSLVGLLALVAYIPGMTILSDAITTQIVQFLAAFGNGDALSGVVVISLAFTLVGALFDTYSFYYRSL